MIGHKDAEVKSVVNITIDILCVKKPKADFSGRISGCHGLLINFVRINQAYRDKNNE